MSSKVPVLIVAWRRPAHLRVVIDALRSYEPTEVYVVIDGPRSGVLYEDERLKIEESKSVILTDINWKCNLIYKFRDENLGCGRGVAEAITWFFDHVEFGIIIEDDVVISQLGLEFLSKSLTRQKGNKEVFAISAFNPFPFLGFALKQRYVYVWGWATWKDRWVEYSFEISNQASYSRIPKVDRFWSITFNDLKKIDTWDYQLQHLIFIKNYKVLVSAGNQVENIGFDELATHTKSVTDKPKRDLAQKGLTKLHIFLPNYVSDLFDFKFVRKKRLRYKDYLEGIFRK